MTKKKIPTCKWCGVKLRRDWSSDKASILESGDPETELQVKDYYGTTMYWKGQRGCYGHGFFCSQSCGYFWAVRVLRRRELEFGEEG